MRVTRLWSLPPETAEDTIEDIKEAVDFSASVALSIVDEALSAATDALELAASEV